ncbi:MAG: glycosyltransferase family 4 protein [Armatimonadetes bacterium]|nr:glycosyltransferase family 4 protein [Armatimonadota bacterium]
MSLKAGVYSTSWDYCGGGEKVLGVIAERLLAHGWDVTLFGEPLPDIPRLSSVLALNLEGCRARAARPAFEPVLQQVARFAPRAARLIYGRTALSFARNLDLLVFITGEIPPACPARSGFLFVQFPYNAEEAIRLDAHGAPLRPADREKLARLGTWDYIACPSQFVRRWIDLRWKSQSHVHYPPAQIDECDSADKERTILTVGRFYAHGPTKKHAVMIDAFKQLCDRGLSGWKLRVVGGTHPSADDQRYLSDIQERSAGYPIEITTDLTFQQLLPLYASASIYWHATGALENADATPELFEQFGMSIVEAMASGAVPVVIDGGGPSEIVRDGLDGFVWQDTATLMSRTLSLIHNPDLLENYRHAAEKRAQEFSRASFEQGIDAYLSTFQQQAVA